MNPITAIALLGKSVAGVFNKRYDVKDNKQLLEHDLQRGEQSIDREIQKRLDNSWKDEFLLPLIVSPLIIGFLISFIMFFTLSSQYISGLIELEVFIDELYEVAMVMPYILDNLSTGYEFILLCVVLSSFGMSRFILPYFQLKKTDTRKPLVRTVYKKKEEDIDPLYPTIRKHEGFKSEIYLDDKGNRTIGAGINLEYFSEEDSKAIVLHRLNEARQSINHFIQKHKLPSRIDDALTELTLWIGAGKVSKFVNTLKALEDHDFKLARKHFEDSKLYREYTTRAKTIADKIWSEE